MIKHLSFFEVLAGLEETDSEWNPTAAGLVTLRLVDSWIEFGPAVVGKDTAGVGAVRDTILKIPMGNPVRSVLNDIVGAVVDSAAGDMTAVTPKLQSYARALDYAARWTLAADVYQTIIDRVNPVEDPDAVIDAQMQRGYCFRMLGQWDDASEAYAEAGSIAAASEDLVMILRARMGDAKIAMDRGNLPLAEEILEDTIHRSSSPRLREVRALALHDRAFVAQRRGDYERAVRLGYEALSGLTRSAARDRALHDIAVSFLELGVLTAARDAFILLAATAEEQYVRWAATINLLDIAARDMREAPFDMYGRELGDADLPASLRVHYHLLLGRGYRTFGAFEKARTALEHTIEIATENNLNQLIFEAEAEMRALTEQVEHRVVVAPRTPPEDLSDVADALREMRETAGLAAE